MLGCTYGVGISPLNCQNRHKKRNKMLSENYNGQLRHKHGIVHIVCAPQAVVCDTELNALIYETMNRRD